MNQQHIHYVNSQSLQPPFPANCQQILLGMGCFWGAERVFWQLDGVHVTAVGYAGGTATDPSYEQVCSGNTGHAEVVLVVYDPLKISLQQLLIHFWERHDPTQGMRQGNDIGSQYRSAIYAETEQQLAELRLSKQSYQAQLDKHGHGTITTEISANQTFYYAEAYHQQYLAKNPAGYCGLGGTGVSCQ